MEQEKIVEQPELEINEPIYSEMKENETEVDEINSLLGSTGKFKSQKELLKAYQNLEAEFTRKSQKLKELEKTLSEKTVNDEVEKNNETPKYLNDDWAQSVGKFLEENPSAKSFASEICELVINDNQVASSACPLETAWQIVASKNFIDKKALTCDNEFINDYVLNNKELLNKVVKHYIENNLASKAPVLISNVGASEFSVAKKFKPKSFEDAKFEAEKLF